MMIMRFFLTFFIKAYVVGALFNCIDAIQVSNHNICLYKEVKKKCTGCNLKTTEFLDCALIGVCAVIRSNTVYSIYHIQSGYQVSIFLISPRKHFCGEIRKASILLD